MFDEEIKEKYIYAGYKNHTHFFIHIINSMRDFTVEISKKVYNYMVNIDIITQYEENVVIYQIHPVSCIVDLIILQNYDKQPHTRFRYDNQYMSKYFWELWTLPKKPRENAENDEAFIIEYNYSNQSFSSYHLLETFTELMTYRLPEDFVFNQTFPISSLKEYYVFKEIDNR
jgi:hypothetical protein